MSTVNGTRGAPPNGLNNNNHFNPSMAIIIVVLIGALLVVAIFSLYIRRCTQGDDENNNRGASNGNQSVHFYERPGEGLDRTVIDALPVVKFSVVKTLKEGKEDLECAVCLEKFEEDETLRLLPKCSHVFHTECIDVWFLSHSTCPLCRASVKPTVDEINAGVPEVGEVSRRIIEAQEELVGSARQLPDADGVLHEEESGSDVERDIGRDNKRNSARLALFRNSDSFRQAARRVEVGERLATLSARYPASSADVQKSPQRTSSLNCIHFSLQRTGSSGAAGTGDQFYSSELMFKYGSQRYGAVGSSFNNSLGRLGSLNERELQGTESTDDDLSNVKSNATLEEEEGASTSSAGGEQWENVDLNGVAPHAQIVPKSQPAVNFDNPDVSTTPDTRQLMPGKPRSGPLTGKQVNAAHRKTGSYTWEQRVRLDRGSFRGLRGSFALHRSVSEGRAHILAIEHPPAQTEPRPPAGVAPQADTENATFAQRTMQWLSGGNKHFRSSSARASLDQRNALQQIVTE